jgi:hypothetical protein
MLILHPFRSGDEVFRDPENTILEGRYGTEPDASMTASFRSVLHAELDKGTRADALDKGFYIRLLISAAVFLILYAFFSIVVRDPVPMIDELLIGALGAFASWFALERRTLSSPDFSDRSAELRKALDSALFRSSRVAAALEECLQDAESLDPGKYSVFLGSSLHLDMSEEDKLELSSLATVLEAHIPSGSADEVKRLLSEKASPAVLLSRIKSHRKADLPVLLSYVRLRNLLGVEL